MKKMNQVPGVEQTLLPLVTPQAVPFKLESERHTLYVEEVELTQHPIEIDIQMAEGSEGYQNNIKSYFEEPAHKKYTLYINEFEEESRGLHDLFQKLREGDVNDTLDVRIHSPGGYISELQCFHNIFKEIFCNRVTTYLDNFGYSCGGFIFLMGDNRVAYEHSELMLHQASYGSFGAMNSVKSHVEFSQKRLERFIYRILGQFMTNDEISDMLNGKDFWLDVDDMVERNMVHVVVVDGISLDVEAYKELKAHEEKGGSREEFWDKLNQKEEGAVVEQPEPEEPKQTKRGRPKKSTK